MTESVIVSAVRTPIGKMLGALAPLKAPQLGALVVREALTRAGVDGQDVDEVIMGNVVSAGMGQNPARQAALGAGLPGTVAAMTVNKVCASGLKAVALARQAIAVEDSDIVVAGGMESLTHAPYLIPGARSGLKFQNQSITDSALHDGLWCAFEDWPMGCAAEYIADKYNITRDDQDRFSLESHRRAIAATQAGRFTVEILPVEVSTGRGSNKLVSTDEAPRADTSLEKLASLPPAFQENGTVTAGNAPGLNDGAAALVVTSDKIAEQRNLKPLARIVAYAVAGAEPRDIFITPALAVRKVLAKANMSLNDIDVLEINEAFAAQMLACKKELDWDESRVNVNGGAVALGHPLACTGARILVTLLHVLQQRQGRYGIAALCLGGGESVAMIVENWA